MFIYLFFHPQTSGLIWNGTEYVSGKVWNGTIWSEEAKIWVGTEWVSLYSVIVVSYLTLETGDIFVTESNDKLIYETTTARTALIPLLIR